MIEDFSLCINSLITFSLPFTFSTVFQGAIAFISNISFNLYQATFPDNGDEQAVELGVGVRLEADYKEFIDKGSLVSADKREFQCVQERICECKQPPNIFNR